MLSKLYYGVSGCLLLFFILPSPFFCIFFMYKRGDNEIFLYILFFTLIFIYPSIIDILTNRKIENTIFENVMIGIIGCIIFAILALLSEEPLAAISVTGGIYGASIPGISEEIKSHMKKNYNSNIESVIYKIIDTCETELEEKDNDISRYKMLYDDLQEYGYRGTPEEISEVLKEQIKEMREQQSSDK